MSKNQFFKQWIAREDVCILPGHSVLNDCHLLQNSFWIMSTLRQVSSFILLIFSLAVSAQTSQTNLKVPGSKITVPFRQKDTSYWVDNFRQFRDAIFQRDKTKAKVLARYCNTLNLIWSRTKNTLHLTIGHHLCSSESKPLVIHFHSIIFLHVFGIIKFRWFAKSLPIKFFIQRW